MPASRDHVHRSPSDDTSSADRGQLGAGGAARPVRCDDARLEAFLADVRKRVGARLDGVLGEARARGARAGAHAATIVDALATLVGRGGKRLRPALTLAAFRACSGEGTPPMVIEAGCAWELLQAYFLIHDDWMDGDSTRRGGPAVHVAMTAHHAGDEHLGASAAILAGDLACALAHRAILGASSGDRDAEDAVRAAAAAFAGVHADVVLGQAIDLTLGAFDAITQDEVEQMHALKTGSYTVRGPVEIGAILARASEDARAALARFAQPMGVAFQLRDDLLGAFGDPTTTGKPVGGDVRAGKRTVLAAEAESRVHGAERDRLRATLAARGSAPEGDVRWTIGLFERSGARDAVERRIDALVADALTALSGPAIASEGGALLGALATHLARRTA